ncbi:hypothetical protein G9A89_014509 [Geosiphon pyriformis]|nr:hypothetical protein G9A89_014509 [Geosiphon pyriformis]
MSPIPKKNRQCLQNPKLTPKASEIPNNLTTPDENTLKKPKTETGIKSSCGINSFFSMKAWCLAQTNQILSQKERQNSHTKPTMLKAAILESSKTETDSRYHSPKTKPLHRAIQTVTSETHVESNYKTHKKNRAKPEHAFQINA